MRTYFGKINKGVSTTCESMGDTPSYEELLENAEDRAAVLHFPDGLKIEAVQVGFFVGFLVRA